MDINRLIAAIEYKKPPGFKPIVSDACHFCVNFHHSYQLCQKYDLEFKGDGVNGWLQYHYNCDEFKKQEGEV